MREKQILLTDLKSILSDIEINEIKVNENGEQEIWDRNYNRGIELVVATIREWINDNDY